MNTFDPEMKALLLKRLETRKEQGRLAGIYQLDNSIGRARHFTPEQMIEEARKETPVGEEILIAEKRFMDEMKRRM